MAWATVTREGPWSPQHDWLLSKEVIQIVTVFLWCVLS